MRTVCITGSAGGIGAATRARLEMEGARVIGVDVPSATAYQIEETARMQRVQRGLLLYKRIEIGLLALGLALASVESYGRALYAVALGLILEAGLMLAFDLRAARRAERYLEMLKSRS